MKGIFITGTDTGVGKTVVTGYLAKYLSQRGYKVITQKWIQTGCPGNFSSDIKTHLEIMGKVKRDVKKYLCRLAPYIFKPACSAHLASETENKRISRNKIIKSFRSLAAEFDLVIVEGLGGALVPLDKSHLVIDIVRELNLPVIVVVGNKLGAINHALLTIEALTARKLKIIGLVFNNLKNEDRRILEDNPRIIKALSKQRILGVLPWESEENQLHKCFVPIGNQILRSLAADG